MFQQAHKDKKFKLRLSLWSFCFMYQITGGWHLLLYFLTGGGNKNHRWFFLEITVKIEITCDLKSPVINPPSPSFVDGGFITGDLEITCDLGSRNST